LDRDKKAAIVEELGDKFARTKLAVVADYRGLKVPVFEELRRELRKNDAEIRVVKNTLLSRAIQGTPFVAMDQHLQGTTALALTEGDPVAPAKTLVEFIKKYPALTIKTAVLDGAALTAEDVTALSKLPSKEELLGRLAGVLVAVPTNFVQVLCGVPRKLVYALQALHDKKANEN
jgi:large subunit ribosomal protein L10